MGTKSDEPDDSETFRKAMSGVNRNSKNYRAQKVTHRTPENTRPLPRNRGGLPATSISFSQPAIDETSSGDSVLFVRPGLQRKNIRRLKRGEFPVESVLDLHGLRSHEAAQHLEDFISTTLNAGLRCVLIIHGKGYRSENRGGVLKPFTVNWLKDIAEVLAFCSAVPRDGGTGAVYVLLKSGTGKS